LRLDNYPEPGKRPLSSITPVIIEHQDGSFYLAVGGVGGSKIFPSVFQVILNLDWGMNLGESIEFGRVHDQLYPTRVDVDDTYPRPFMNALRQRGHNMTGLYLLNFPRGSPSVLTKNIVLDITRLASSVQAVMKDDDVIWGK
jgi:gamma-glutamyltranspeptidase/glutathione hydrolase/leukotriene-C4 hydrolase